jgi:hypothetical protein
VAPPALEVDPSNELPCLVMEEHASPPAGGVVRGQAVPEPNVDSSGPVRSARDAPVDAEDTPAVQVNAVRPGDAAERRLARLCQTAAEPVALQAGTDKDAVELCVQSGASSAIGAASQALKLAEGEAEEEEESLGVFHVPTRSPVRSSTRQRGKKERPGTSGKKTSSETVRAACLRDEHADVQLICEVLGVLV